MTTTTIDLETDARRLRTAIAALVRRFRLAERADLACCGMTVAQAATLEVLSRRDRMPLGDLGRELGISPSTLTRNLDRLVERSLVRREPHAADRRVVTASLTRAGIEAATAVDRAEQDFARDILSNLDASRSGDVVETLEDLLAAVRTATERCCPGAFESSAPGCECDEREPS